jgi:steroid delta-isomerase-like uncharacterized protein
MEAEERNKKLVLELATAFAQGDEARLDALVAPGFVEHGAPREWPPGFAGAKAMIRTMRAAIPDLKPNIEEVIAEGDKVVLVQTVTGTHRGPLYGVPPSGARVSLRTIDLFRVERGKVAEHWGVADNLGLMQQIGAVPAPRAP